MAHYLNDKDFENTCTTLFTKEVNGQMKIFSMENFISKKFSRLKIKMILPRD
jgi:hypothetical protein